MNENQKLALSKQGYKAKDVAALLDIHAAYLSGVFAGRYKSPGLRKRICKLLGKSGSYLWPSTDDQASTTQSAANPSKIQKEA